MVSTNPDDKEYVKLKQRQRMIDAVMIQLKNHDCLASHKYKKKPISSTLKRLVWNHHIGEMVGKTKCLCCRLTEITQLSFHCGHVLAEVNGGGTTLSNLRPICQNCNSSMGTKNMNAFMNTLV